MGISTKKVVRSTSLILVKSIYPQSLTFFLFIGGGVSRDADNFIRVLFKSVDFDHQYVRHIDFLDGGGGRNFEKLTSTTKWLSLDAKFDGNRILIIIFLFLKTTGGS